MSHNHKSYLDIPTAKRRKMVAKVMTELKETLGRPFLSPEQVKEVHTKIERLGQWAAGSVPSD